MASSPFLTGVHTPVLPAHWRDFVALTKPRVMTLVVFTGLCGLLAAPGHIHPVLAFTAILCIALGAGAAASLNQWWEADIDAKMKRTASRPLPAGRMDRQAALHFGVGLSFFSVILMGMATNWLASAVLIGWVAVTGDITLMPVLLFLIIFMWTPPHFWALALFVKTDYAAAGIPMLPVVSGEVATRRQIWFYTAIMAVAALAPVLLNLTGVIYGTTALLGTALFALFAFQVYRRRESDPARMKPEKRLFKYSILYLFLLFGAVVVDRWLLA